MFICETCIHPNLRWNYMFGLSRGPCENCGYTDFCKDIYHSEVVLNPNWKDDLQRELDNAGITASSSRYHNKNDKDK